MNSSRLLISAIAFVIIGAGEGELLSFMAGDPKGRRRLINMSLGILGACIGWLFSLILPVPAEIHLPAAISFEIHFAALLLYVYFLVFHPRSRLADDVESNWPLNETHSGDVAPTRDAANLEVKTENRGPFPAALT